MTDKILGTVTAVFLFAMGVLAVIVAVDWALRGQSGPAQFDAGIAVVVFTFAYLTWRDVKKCSPRKVDK